MHSLEQIEKLLFTNLEGNRQQLQDVIDDGLDGGYENRIPELIKLAENEEPYYSLLAYVMLISWGNQAGFISLLNLIQDPTQVPWLKKSVVYDRIYNCNSAFEMLADALRTSYYCEQDQQLKNWRIQVTQYFLKLYDQYYFGQSLALAILKGKEITPTIQGSIIEAIENSFIRLNQGIKIEFDLAFQVACLIITIEPNEDELAAYYANRLLSLNNLTRRVLQELCNSLQYSPSPKALPGLEGINNRLKS
jgi:hypothetical protein